MTSLPRAAVKLTETAAATVCSARVISISRQREREQRRLQAPRSMYDSHTTPTMKQLELNSAVA